ncbi:MAG: ankyrin repeat domain-containing protein, partial [Chlamydiales bacterium]
DLHCALHEGNKEAINLVLSCDAIVSPFINECSEEGGTPLTLACELDDPEVVERLIRLGAIVSEKRRDGVAPIDIAVMRNCLPVVDVLLRYVAPSELTIESAIKKGSPEILGLLIEKHPNLVQYQNASREGLPLIAFKHGNLPLVFYLAKQYPQLFSQPNAEGITAFHFAIDLGAWDMVDFLWDKGVRPAVNDLPNFYDHLLKAGFSDELEKIFHEGNLSEDQLQQCLMTAAQAGNYLAISLLLLPMGAKLEGLRGPRGWRAVHYLAKSNAIFLFRREMLKSQDLLSRLPEEGNKTLPYLAAEHGSTSVLSFLLKRMPAQHISLKDHFHDRSLLYPIFERGNMEAINLIAERFPDYDLVNEPLDAQGTLPVHVAARMGREDILQWLMEKGANFDIQDENGHAPLYYAVRRREKKDVAKILENRIRIRPEELYEAAIQNDEAILDQIMEVGPPDEILNHGLCLAIFRHNIQAALRLHQKGASFHAITGEGWTPTLYASYSGQQKILEIILEEGPIDQRFFKNDNALHLACKQGHSHCVKLLLKAGFSPDQPNRQEKSPLELSKSGLVQEVLKQEKGPCHKQLSAFVRALEDKAFDRVASIIGKLPPLEIVSMESNGTLFWGPPLLVALRLCKDKDMQLNILKQAQAFPPNVNPKDHVGDTLANLLVVAGNSPFNHAPIDFQARNRFGQTLLHLGAVQEDPALLKELLEEAPLAEINGEDQDGHTPIFYAILKQNEKNIPILSKAGANLDHFDYRLLTPLLTACQQGFFSSVKELLAFGADPNRRGTSIYTSALAMAIAKKQQELAIHLLTHGAKVDILKESGHPIHLAAQVDDPKLLGLLAAKGIPLDLQDEKGLQPVHHAALHGEMSALKAITTLQRGLINAPVEEVTTKSDQDKEIVEKLRGSTPLLLAAQANRPEIVEYLLNHRANPEARTENNEDVLSLAAQGNASQSVFGLLDPFKVSANLDNIIPAIIGAIRNDNLDTMASLYKGNVPINADLLQERSGLHIASSSGALACTAWLLQRGANPLLETPLRQNAFALAAENSSYEQFQLLLEYTQQDPDHVNHQRRTLLHLAATKGNFKHVLLLLHLDVDINFTDIHGLTPLHDAAREGHLDIVRLLLSCGADATLRTPDGRLPKDVANKQEVLELFNDYERFIAQAEKGETELHRAVKMGNPLAVRLLADIFDVNEGDSHETTPLHLAVERGQVDTVLHLMRAGADPSAEDKEGVSPRLLAERAKADVKYHLLDILNS